MEKQKEMDRMHVKHLPAYNQASRHWSRRRRSRTWLRVTASLCLASIVYFAYHITLNTTAQPPTQRLSVTRLQQQHATCASLRKVPSDPAGPRTSNKRWNGARAVLIRNATVWTGEPVRVSTSPGDEIYAWIKADVLLEYGLIAKVSASSIKNEDLPNQVVVINAHGRQLTAGIVDMHSHAGMGEFANLGDDTNELSGDVTPYVRSLDAFSPIAPEISYIKSGGVTTSLILPGSGNNIAGEAYVLKLASGNSSGRAEISQEDMLADPDRNWRYMKMACGENPKRVYGKIGRGPFSRMGEAWQFRHALEQARKYVDAQNDWCHLADTIGAHNMVEYLPSELEWDSLGAVLRGQVRVNTHCYTVADLDAYVRHTNEFKFRVYAFHHAHQTYLVPDLLKRAYGGTPAAALFADNMYYKVEAYTATEKAGKILYDNGIVPVYVSDNPVLNSQHVVFEAAKAYANGLPYHVALNGVTAAPAALLGLQDRVGKVKAGLDADIVLWDSDPLSIAATPVQVWIDGAPQFFKAVELKKPITPPIQVNTDLSHDLHMQNTEHVVFKNVKLTVSDSPSTAQVPGNIVVSGGSIVCSGSCESEIEAVVNTHDPTILELNGGQLTTSFTAFGTSLGLLEIDAAKDTQDGGYSAETFSAAVDGLALDGKQLSAALQHGVTQAISAPSRGSIDAKGLSVGFFTGATSSLEKDAIWQSHVALHYPLTSSAKNPSISAAIGSLRDKLLKTQRVKNKSRLSSEEISLYRVVFDGFPLVLSVHKADTIASIIRLKKEVEQAVHGSSKPSKKLRIVIIGAAESHLVAHDLVKAGISVILAPLLSYAQSWDERRSLTGAPLTNGTTIDALLDAGVLVGISGNEIWESRNLGLMAAWAYKNSEGRLSRSTAFDLVGKNIFSALGLKEPELHKEWLVWEGDPLEIGARLRGLGSNGKSNVWL